VSQSPERSIVTVQIAGEEYSIRAQASPEYTRECAAYVDRALSEIMKQGTLIQAHKGAILAALALADELFQTRAELEEVRTELARRSDALIGQIDERLGGADLAARL
jgi:cell division protein ZapA